MRRAERLADRRSGKVRPNSGLRSTEVHVKTLPLSEVKAQLSKLVDEVSSRDEQVTITRNGRPAAMLVSPDEIESWRATVEIMSDPDAMAAIRRARRNLKEGKVLSEQEIEELFDLRPGEAAPVIGPRRKRGARTARNRREART